MQIVIVLIFVLLLYLIVQWFLCQKAVGQGEQRLKNYQAEKVELSYGDMTYVDKGSGETILVAHGISGGYDQAFDTVKDKADEYRILAPSRFGYLGSDTPKDATPASQAKAYVELLDKLGIDKVYMLGTSAGGTNAIRFALDYPERTAGLILYCSVAPLTKKPEKYMKYQGPPAVLCNNYAMWLMKPLFGPIMGMESDTIYEMMPVNKRKAGMVMDASITNPDMARNYAEYPIEKLKVPTLILHAEDDKLSNFSAMSKAARRFPNSTFVSFPDGGHLMSGHGAEIDEALSRFIKENQ